MSDVFTAIAEPRPDRPAKIDLDTLAGVDWEAVGPQDFWALADRIQAETLSYAKDLFAFVERADPETLRAILVQYRYFTVYYIPDLSLLIARLKSGSLRSFLADILFDELGRGNSERAHPRLYDDFMRSIGAAADELLGAALKSNVDLLDEARRQLVDPLNSGEFAIGLRGMGGECVCQVYISQLYESLIRNPFIIRQKPTIDWRFWKLHVGEHDIEHARVTRKLIDSEIVSHNARGRVDLGRGYAESMKSWKQFWDNIFIASKRPPQDSARTTIQLGAHVQLLS